MKTHETTTPTKMKGDFPEGYITPAELTVWRLVALGRQTKQIAAELGVSFKTAEKHRAELHRKLRCGTNVELCLRAVEHGVITIALRPLQPVHVGAYERHFIPA